MDSAPRFDPETTSVCFHARVGQTSRQTAVSRFGSDIPPGEAMVDAYIEHAEAIDREIARRVAAGRIEPVWLASTLPPLP